jgi:hypothetical protein
VDQTTAMVRAIAGWTNCQSFEFYNWLAPDQAVIELDKHQTLRRFIAHRSGLKGNILAKRQFLHKLTYLELVDVPECDAVLAGLGGSNAIASIYLRNCKLSSLGLHALSGCHNLNSLHMDDCPVDSSALDAISSIKSLKELVITKAHLVPGQLPKLVKLKFIPCIELDLTNWPKTDIQKLLRVLPRVVPLSSTPGKGQTSDF